MELKGIWTCLGVVLAVCTAWISTPAHADTDAEVADAAAYLIRQSTIVDRRGTHNLLLKAIRHLDDPAALPLFEYLSDSEHPGLKIHGILGKAELSPDKQVDLARIAQIQDPAVQSTVITAAMDDGLLSDNQADQILAWDGLADEVKVLVAVREIEAGRFDDPESLKHTLTRAKKLGGSALAALLLTQLDDPAGPEYLRHTLDSSDDPQRDAVRAMLLQTALQRDFDKVADWALDIAKQTDADPVLQLAALRTAMRFKAPGAVQLWHERYDEAKDSPANRVRLALTALHLAPWLEPDVFKTLRASDDPLINAIGKVGVQITTGSSESEDAIAQLLELGHPMVNAWALDYAREHASEIDAQVILLGLILAYEHSPQLGKARRLDEAIDASQALQELNPNAASQILRSILIEPGRDKLLIQAILLGLVRARSPEAADVVAGIEDQLNSADARGLALLLIARSDRPMDEKQMQDLALLARGSGSLEDSLRIQAAWTHLKRTGQIDQTVARVLGQITDE